MSASHIRHREARDARERVRGREPPRGAHSECRAGATREKAEGVPTPRASLMNGAAASAEDDTMARQLRAVAIKLGRQGDSTRHPRSPSLSPLTAHRSPLTSHLSPSPSLDNSKVVPFFWAAMCCEPKLEGLKGSGADQGVRQRLLRGGRCGQGHEGVRRILDR